MDEEKSEVTSTPTFLEQVKAEREALEKVRADNQKLVGELRELKAVELLSGKTDAGQPSEKPKETPQEYAQRMLRGG